MEAIWVLPLMATRWRQCSPSGVVLWIRLGVVERRDLNLGKFPSEQVWKNSVLSVEDGDDVDVSSCDSVVATVR